MTNSNPAMNCAGLASSRGQHPLARRSTALASHAQTLLAVPPAFWENLPDGLACRQRLASTLQELRSAEEAFYHALAARVGLIIRRQRLERSCWDFLASTRELIRSVLGREWSAQWKQLGFADATLRIPQTSEGQMRVLAQVVDFIRAHPEIDEASFQETLAQGSKLVRDFSNVSSESERVRLGLSAAVGRLNRTVVELKSVLNSLHAAIRARLRARDPRWIFADSLATGANTGCDLSPAVAENELQTVGSFQVSGAFSLCQRRDSDETLLQSKQDGKKTGLCGAKEQTPGLSIASAAAWLLPVT